MEVNVAGICAIAVIAALLSLAIKKGTPQLALLLTIAAGVVIFGVVVSFLPSTVTKIQSLINATGLNTEYGVVLLKSLGICFLCQFASDACKDAGQSSLAGKVELTGKLMIVILALPLVESILQTAGNLLGG